MRLGDLPTAVRGEMAHGTAEQLLRLPVPVN
jgi:hypothetical protein